MFNWDDLRFFLELSRRGKLVAAGRRLGVDHTTVSRRLRTLEKSLNARLFDRSPRGYVLTEAGRALVAHAEAMEAESLAAYEDSSGEAAVLTGTVRVAATDALSVNVIAPALALFREQHPEILIELVASTPPLNLTRREADIAVTVARPESGRLVASKLTDYQLALYGSPAYLDRHDPIRRLSDLNRHDFIWYVDDLMALPQLRYLEEYVKSPNIVFRSTSVAAQQQAVESGVGLGFLHSFAANGRANLIRVLPEKVVARRAFWLVMHEDLRRVARIEAVSAFLRQVVGNLGG